MTTIRPRGRSLSPPAAAPATPSAPAPDWRLAASLACGLYCLYLLTFSGTFRSIDELALFGVAENLVLSGRLEPLLVAFAPYHNPVGLFEPGYPLLAAPLYALAGLWVQVSNVHAVMLLNPAVTAATGGLLYLFARRLGYDRRAGLAVALAWGLGSMAWPYTKSFLREPVVALLWVLAFMGAAGFMERPRARLAVLALAPAVLAVSIKAASVVAWPVLGALLLWALYRAGRLSPTAVVALAAAGVLAAVLAGLVLLALRGNDALALLRQLLGAPFTREGLLVVYGLLLSPGKSVLLYSPVLVVAVAGWPAFYRRHAALALALAALWALLLYSLRLSVWTGGLTWGPRFLLPLLPLSLLPALELLPRRRWAVTVAGLSAVFQAIVSSEDWSRLYQVLHSRYPGQDPDLTVGLDWSRFLESPAALALQAWGPSNFDQLWLYTGLAGEVKFAPALGAALALAVAVAAVGLGLAWSGRAARAARLGARLGLGAALAATAALLAGGYWLQPDYPDLTAATMRQLAARVAESRPALLLNVSPDVATYRWLGLVKGPQPRVWVSPAQTEGFERWLAPAGRLTLVIDRPHIASSYPGDALAGWLNDQAYRLGSTWIGGYEVVEYAAGPNPGQTVSAAYRWSNGLALTRFAVPAATRPGAALLLDLEFAPPAAAWPAYDRFFANLLDPSGQVVAGHEAELQFGRLAAEGWPAGAAATDRRGLWLPPDAPAGEYVLVVGFSNGSGYVPATLPGGQPADYVELARVRVGP